MKAHVESAVRFLEAHEHFLFLRTLLFPLLVVSWCYGLVLDLRWVSYEFRRRVRVPCTVISVGNITVGGTGKTPLVAWIAESLSRARVRVAIVSHGYGAESGGNLVVLRGQRPSAAISSKAGDEAVLLSRTLPEIPVASGRRKTHTIVRTWRTVRPQVIVLDDAFQSISIERDMDIVTLDATNPWGSGHLLPRGRLREKRECLSRADLIVLTRCNQVDRVEDVIGAVREFSDAPIVQSEHAVRGLWRFDTWEKVELERLMGAPVYAFSGIARPLSFEQTLGELGARVAGVRRFADHHFFSAADVDEIEKAASEVRAQFVVTTEKDAMRLDVLRNEGLGGKLLVLGIEIRITEDAPIMEHALLSCIAGH